MTQPFRRFHHLAVLSALMASAGLVLSGCGNRTNPTPTPVAPTITSFTAAQPNIAPGGSTALNWQVTGSTPLTLSLDNGIGTVSGNSYNVSPAATTNYTLTATNSAGQVSKNLTVTVNTPANQAPTVTSPIGNKNVSQGAAAQTVDLKTIFNDAEDGSAGLSFSVGSSNLAVTSASISGSTLTLNFGLAGTAQITVTAKDSGNLTASTSFSVTVTQSGTPPANQPPVVTNPIANKNVNSGAAAQTVDLKTVFNDAEDGTNLTFTASSSNTGVVNASVAGSNLNLTFGSVGTAQVTVTAKDSGNLSASTNFSVTVASGVPTNQAPTVVSPIANKSVSSGAAAQSVNLKTVFNDAEDGTNLTFTASSSNNGVVSTSVANGNLTLTFGSTGTAQVTATAKDSGNLSVSTNFSVTVGSGGGGTSCISANFMNVQPYNNSLPNPTLTVTCTNTKASVATNAIPNHQTGSFPNSGNPHSISAQNRTYPLTLSPTKAASITQQTLTLMGVAVNGIGLEPFANEYYNNDSNSGWRYEALAYTMLGKGKNLGIDSSNAHVQPTGNYHYHGLPNGLVTVINKGTAMTIIGYIGDGFPVYAVYGYNTASDASSGTKEVKTSYQLKSGTRPSGPGGTYDGTFVQDYEYVAGLGDLDECNGRFGVTPEYPSGIYHYYITKTYPFIPRCFVGTPESYYVSAPK